MTNAREKIRQKILADIRKRVDTYWSEIQMNDAGFSNTANVAKEELQKWAAMDLKFLLETVEMLREEQRLWSDGTIVAKMSDLEAENERLAKCRHECKIECLLGEYEKLQADNTNLRAELEAANARWEETASDNTGYALSHLDGIFSVSDPQGHVVCEFLRERAENGGRNERG